MITSTLEADAALECIQNHPVVLGTDFHKVSLDIVFEGNRWASNLPSEASCKSEIDESYLKK